MSAPATLPGHAAMLLFAAAISVSFSLGGRAAPYIDPAALAPARFLIAAILIASMTTVTLLLKVIQIIWTKQRFKRLLTDFFRQHDWALDKYPATAKEVGEILGVERNTLRYKLNKYGLLGK